MDDLTLMCQLYAKGNESVAKLKRLGLTDVRAIANTSPKRLMSTMNISETMAKRMISHCSRLSATANVRKVLTTRRPKIKVGRDQTVFRPIATRINDDELNSLAGLPKPARQYRDTKKKAVRIPLRGAARATGTPVRVPLRGAARPKDMGTSKLFMSIPILGEAQRYTMDLIRDGQEIVTRLVKVCFFWKPYIDSLLNNWRNRICRITPNWWR